MSSSSSVTVVTAEKQRARTLVWVTLHALGALLLLAVWFVVVQLLFPQSLQAKYDFSPTQRNVLPLAAFQKFYKIVSTQYALWTFVLVCVALRCAHQKPSGKSARVIRTVRWLLCGLALLFVVIQVIAWTKSTHYVHQMETSKEDIGAAFNDLFCETRALQVCVQEDELEKLLVVIGGDQSVNTSKSVSTSAAKATTLAIWLRCRDLLVENHGRVSSQQLKLLSDCNSTAATDTWCGNHFLSEVNGESVDLRAGTATAAVPPFDLNPEIFQSLKVEWPTRYTGDTMFLSSVVVFTIALSWCLKKLTREAGDGFELIDMKTGQRTSAGSTPHLVV